ncbi:hypothetical protein [Alicyclobacillus fastidiosus]|nr:hypothetical protein [Alicyclobacillus fastidiosus]GMA61735.1 hypothetical protein GCM10025859_21750 [Alicyclobacillus fastidiosus]
MFALEQHVPLAILQNPQLQKAEWAWKLLVMQQLTASFSALNDDTERGTLSVGSRQTEQAGSSNGDGQADVSRGFAESALHSPAVGSATSLGMERAEVAVRKLWELLADTAAQSDKLGESVDLNFKTDPPLLPFASMNRETIALAENKHDASRLQAWVLQDRMLAGVLDNPYERMGGGVFFPTSHVQSQDPPYQAVKWKAHRQTRIGAAGKLIHRIRLEMEVQGRPLTCIVTAQRPQLFVHFVSDDTRLLSHLKRGEEVVSQPLRACGWELIGWTAGQGVHGEDVDR